MGRINYRDFIFIVRFKFFLHEVQVQKRMLKILTNKASQCWSNQEERVMNKKLVALTAVFVLTAGFVYAQDATVNSEVSAPAAIEVGNTICPLTDRELNLADANDYTKMEVQGYNFNVCPTGKADYDKDPTPYATKVAEAVAAAQAAEAAAEVPPAG